MAPAPARAACVLAALAAAASTAGASRVLYFDVVVYGATPAGISAAIVAANGTGLRVALLEPGALIGGMSGPGGIGMRDINQQATGACADVWYGVRTGRAARGPGRAAGQGRPVLAPLNPRASAAQSRPPPRSARPPARPAVLNGANSVLHHWLHLNDVYYNTTSGTVWQPDQPVGQAHWEALVADPK